MSVKPFATATTASTSRMLTPCTRDRQCNVSSPPEEKGSKFDPDRTLITPPPLLRDSESFLHPKVQTVSSHRSSSSHRVLFEEMISAQLDLEGVPEEDFFLVGPKQAFSMDDPVEPLLVRPSPRGSFGEGSNGSPSTTTPLPLFRSIIDEDTNEEEVDENDLPFFFGDVQETQQLPAALPQVRLKPRPFSFQDDQAHSLEPICTFAVGGPGNECLG